MKITVTELTTLVEDRYFKRGREYYKNGMVELMAIKESSIKAYVLGNALYTVYLKQNLKQLAGSCNCQAFFDYGPCKHIAATGLALIDHYGSGYSPSEDYQYFKETKDELQNGLHKLSKEQLIDVIIYVSSKNPEEMSNLLEKLATEEQSSNIKSSTQFSWPTGSNKRVLPPQEAKLMLRLIGLVDRFVGHESGICKKAADTGIPVDPHVFRKEIRDYWYNDLNLIDQFIQSKDGQGLTNEERQIILSWKHVIAGKFLYVKNYTDFGVFTSMNGDKENYYAVLAITEDFDRVIPSKAPCLVATALLPYKDVIIWDGLVRMYGVSFGKSMTASFIQECNQLKRNNRIMFQIQGNQ